MSGFLLDTCAISEAMKKRRDAGYARWMSAVDPSRLFLSVITLGEIRRGIALLTDRRKAAGLEAWLLSLLPAYFSQRMLPVDADVADRWGRLGAALGSRGRGGSPVDELIAATALHYDLGIVTRNERHFVHTGVAITNPWSR